MNAESPTDVIDSIIIEHFDEALVAREMPELRAFARAVLASARDGRGMSAAMKPHIWLDSVDQLEFEPLDGSSDMWLVPWPNWLCQVDGDDICGGGSTPLQAYLFWLQSKRAEALIAIDRMERELKRLTA